MGFLDKNKTTVTIVTADVNLKVSCPEGKQQEVKEAFEVISKNLNYNELIILKKVCEKTTIKNMALSMAGQYV